MEGCINRLVSLTLSHTHTLYIYNTHSIKSKFKYTTEDKDTNN